VTLLLLLCLKPCTAQEAKIDTVQNKEGLLELSVHADVSTLLLADRKIDEVVFKVFVIDFFSFMTVVDAHKLAKNEIAFFYTKNERTGKEFMTARYGKHVAKVYSPDDFDQLMVLVKLLEYQVFDKASFSGIKAYDTLVSALK